MKNFDQKDESESKEKADFFIKYPLPEGFEEYADKAWELYQLKSILLGGKNRNKKYKELYDFANKVEINNPVGKKKNDKEVGVNKCYLFHVIIGGSGEITEFFDFEDEDSIEKFLMKLK